MTPAKSPSSRTARRQRTFRHGFYSDSFSSEENRALDENVVGEFNDEMALAKVNAKRLGSILENYEDLDPRDALLAFTALSNFLSTIRELGRARHLLYFNRSSIDQALDELNSLPTNED